MKTTLNKTGDLRIWWIPQVPMKQFNVPVKDVEEGAKLLDVLGEYDLFQFKNRIKPDYCNAGGLQVFDVADGWSDWYDEETGEEDPIAWVKAQQEKVSL